MNTNKIISTNTILFLAIGLLTGFLIWGKQEPAEMHHSMDMQGAMDSMTMSLGGKTGDEFDKAFLSEMIVHHKGAVDMANQVLATSKRPELIKLSNDIISAQTKEIEMMQNWEKTWFK
jgi:uncharacterized protein (DUF305 family)